MKPKLNKKTLQTALKILVSTLLIGFLLYKVDKQLLVENFKLLDKRFIPLIFILLALNYIVGAFRWKKLLIYENTHHITRRYLASLYFIGAFFNNFMPTSVGGDVYKMIKLGQKIGNKAHAFSATFMERFTGVVALVLVSYYGLFKTLGFWVEQLPPTVAENAVLLLAFKIFLFVGFWIAAAVGFVALKLLSKKISIFEKIYQALIAYKDSRSVMVYAFFTSFIIQFIAVFTQYFVFTAIGVTIPLDYALFVFPIITLAGFFIPSLNGIGVQDFLYIELFGVVGIAPEIALSASILYHLFRLGISLVGGVLYAMGKAD